MIGSEMFTLVAGEGRDSRSYLVHKSLLCYHSPYFASALKGYFKEADDDATTLKTVSTKVVDVFAAWLYTQQLPESDVEDGIVLLLYIFADRYNVPKLRKQTMDGLFSEYGPDTDELPGFWSITKAFDHLPHTSPVCRFLVDVYARKWDGLWSEDDDASGELPREFLVEFIAVTGEVNGFEKRVGLPLKMPERCEYHEHEIDETNCCRAEWKARDAIAKATKEAEEAVYR